MVETPLDRSLLNCSDGPDWSPDAVTSDLDLLGVAYGFQAAWLDCKAKLAAIRELDTGHGKSAGNQKAP
ncbi:MAG: hypothetical protein ABWY00_14830 [Dongiaceae bacterium]